MKTKMSMTTIKKVYPDYKVFRAGYCDLQYLFSSNDFRFYNSGVYGWNCDILIDYEHEVIITTGYRNMRGEIIPRKISEHYNDLALDVIRDNSITLSERLETLELIRTNFLKELSNAG